MSKEQALRYNTGKPELSFILEADYAIEGVCEVLKFGSIKYDRSNYKKGFPKEQLIDSLLRHLTKYINGEELDGESHLHHLDHVLANSIFLSYHYNGKKDKYIQLPQAGNDLGKVLGTPEVVEDSPLCDHFPFYARVNFSGYEFGETYFSEIDSTSNYLSYNMQEYDGKVVKIEDYIEFSGYGYIGKWRLIPEWFTEVTEEEYLKQENDDD